MKKTEIYNRLSDLYALLEEKHNNAQTILHHVTEGHDMSKMMNAKIEFIKAKAQHDIAQKFRGLIGEIMSVDIEQTFADEGKTCKVMLQTKKEG